ncbi:MAG: hypothetical protein M3276_03085, partial [Actinomycetota bacterium]|nr:hypothetical protein [Actinomycetota bacterium]
MAHPATCRRFYSYVEAVGHVLDADRRLPLSLSLLREAHAILLTGVRGGYATPGELPRNKPFLAEGVLRPSRGCLNPTNGTARRTGRPDAAPVGPCRLSLADADPVGGQAGVVAGDPALHRG